MTEYPDFAKEFAKTAKVKNNLMSAKLTMKKRSQAELHFERKRLRALVGD